MIMLRIIESSPFAPHVVYTYSGVANKPHRDNDVNPWMMGIWRPVDDEGKLCSRPKALSKKATLPILPHIRL